MRRSVFASRRQGFTLIELLVVIAIIAILAAILFPVFAQAREKARQAACLSNTKQIALALQQYTQDYDETLPVAGFNAQCRGRWQWQLYPYVKNKQVYTCPNLADDPWNPVTNSQCGYQLGTSDRGGYGWNYALQCDYSVTNGDMNSAPGYSLAKIRKPADTIMVGDTGFAAVGDTVIDHAGAGWAMMASDPRNTNISLSFNQPGLYAQFRHNTVKTVTTTQANGNLKLPIDGRANFCFLDGHSKNLSTGQAFQAATSEDGYPLAVETAANHVMPNIQYTLWNIY